MTPVEIIKEAAEAEVRLILATGGTIKARGKKSNILPLIPHLREHKAEIITVLREAFYGPDIGDSNTTSRWWRIRYTKDKVLEEVYCPPQSYSDVSTRHPEAEAVEPFNPVRRTPEIPLTQDEELSIRRWLSHIQETNETTIADVLDQCNTDAVARDYFLHKTDNVPR